MASHPRSSAFFILQLSLLPTILSLQANAAYYDISPVECGCPDQYEVTMRLYLHQFVAGPNHPNRNEEFVIASSYPNGFGTTLVNDWYLTTTPSPNGKVIARAQGIHVQAGTTDANSWYTSFNIVFQDDRFNGSTLQVMGIILAQNFGEWSIMGGTGEFTMAHGNIKFRVDTRDSTSEDAIRELEIRAVYTSITQLAF
ncbi:dirigent protein 1-like [Oryza brachyantha]|nr:dirigent protein 1-like [Oryza brachyantha]